MTSGPDRPAIERFVRGTLGCQCPDEVFRSVAIEHVPAAAGRPSLVQLLVGSRLLIHVVAAPATIPANRWIEQLAAHGRAARDRHGYNRFRLVVAAADAAVARTELEQRFARAAGGDERMHLHVLASDQLPVGLEVASATSGDSGSAAGSVAK